MNIKGFANYGVLAHEKQVIFTVNSKHPHADVSEDVEITLPENWEVAENEYGEILIDTPDGKTFRADEIISSWGDKPALEWFDGEKSHRTILKWNTM